MTEKQLLEAAAVAGRSTRWFQRKIARDAGLKILPASSPITVRSGAYSETFEVPAEDVTVLEPGEAEYLASLDAARKEST